MIEQVINRRNMHLAYKQVLAKKAADKVTLFGGNNKTYQYEQI
jgi:hypothetical protein